MSTVSLQTMSLIASLMVYTTAISYPSQTDIAEGAKNFLKQEIQNKHKTVDLKTISIKVLNNPTINNKNCNSNIAYYFPIYSSMNQRATIIAECKDQDPWKVYIPVNIKFFAHVISAKKSLPKLHVINKDDLSRKKFNVLQLTDNYYADPSEVVGLVLKTSVKQDTVLTSNLLEKVQHGA